jgi:hypothetical protein
MAVMVRALPVVARIHSSTAERTGGAYSAAGSAQKKLFCPRDSA